VSRELELPLITGLFPIQTTHHSNIIAIPKSASEKHLQDNINIFDFEIADLDIKKINEINQNKRLVRDDYSNYDD